jgi:hypothetical protein
VEIGRFHRRQTIRRLGQSRISCGFLAGLRPGARPQYGVARRRKGKLKASPARRATPVWGGATPQREAEGFPRQARDPSMGWRDAAKGS